MKLVFQNPKSKNEIFSDITSSPFARTRGGLNPATQASLLATWYKEIREFRESREFKENVIAPTLPKLIKFPKFLTLERPTNLPWRKSV